MDVINCKACLKRMTEEDYDINPHTGEQDDLCLGCRMSIKTTEEDEDLELGCDSVDALDHARGLDYYHLDLDIDLEDL